MCFVSAQFVFLHLFCIFFLVYFVYYVEITQWQIYIEARSLKRYQVIRCIQAISNVYFVVNIILKKLLEM